VKKSFHPRTCNDKKKEKRKRLGSAGPERKFGNPPSYQENIEKKCLILNKQEYLAIQNEYTTPRQFRREDFSKNEGKV